MTGRIFLVMLAGFLIAGTVAITFANANRKESLEILHRKRAAERIHEYLGILNSGQSRAVIETQLAQLPGIRSTTASVPTRQSLPALADAVRVRLGTSQPVAAADASLDWCYPDYRHGGVDGGPRREWQIRSPTCWLVTVGSRSMLVETPMTIVNEAPLIDPQFLAVLSFGALLLSVVVARVATAPLQRLQNAANAFGSDFDHPPVDERGPSEVRDAARAFNRMQARLRAHMEERATLLASISHDLQTPMTRMRLRLEQMPDEALRQHILRDWYAMRNLVDEGLSLARAAQEKEPLALVDLDSLIDTVVTDATDAGQNVTYGQRSGLQLFLAPNSIGRCLANLVSNAALHAGSAELKVDTNPGQVVICVLDRGPGIAEQEMAEVMHPFVQANKGSKGSGLGLPIAKLLAENNGAKIELANRDGGGLMARLIIPIRDHTAAPLGPQ